MMELILLERIERLGNVGDIVTVRAGYGRNYLLPQERAIVANSANRKLFERRRELLEAKQRSALESAEAQAKALAELELTIARSTSDGTHLYGSISTADLAALLTKHGEEVSRRDILINEQIRTVGTHSFRVRLHPDVVATLSLQIEAENG
ncbi:MAG: 50S ribosomal protein L9 [Mariprofundales bacterium]|nr:50S ribosomal protein L9 [Mariprofundales bacterium]